MLTGRLTRLAAIVLATGLSPVLADDPKPITFDNQVAAIFKRHCVQCHGEARQKAGLDLSAYSAVLKGGSGGPVVVAGRSGTSRVIEAITAADPAERMPPENDPLPKDQIDLIRAWIDSGLRQNDGSAAPSTRGIGFRPTSNLEPTGPPPMPVRLAAVNRPRTVRPFPVLALAASPRAPLVAVSSYECIDLLDPATRKAIGSLPFTQGEPHVLRFSRSGGLLLAAGGRPVRNGSATLFDVKTGERLAEIGDEPDAVLAADISPDERHVALGGSGRVVKLYSTGDGSPPRVLSKHTEWITAIAFSPDGKLLATGDRAGSIHTWDATSGGVMLPLSEHKGAVRSLTWRSDGRVLASTGEDGLIVWWDVARGWPAITRSDAHPPARPPGVHGKIANGVLDAAFGPTGELITCGRDRKVRLWADDGRELRSFSIDQDDPSSPTPPRVQVFPTRVAVTADGATIFVGDSSGRVHSWPSGGQ